MDGMCVNLTRARGLSLFITESWRTSVISAGNTSKMKLKLLKSRSAHHDLK